ncbi:hypothetical protein CVT24_005593 [Panaeolus cyanescens]|uniref:Uncharacterized protein n=1 Tax=Panaeolus cyanescens TaxID=181874 RepID=A0A409YXV7_9AGAR|nr:hypothetical protein CVT24_005593 [Panaeolus cyanescens]
MAQLHLDILYEIVNQLHHFNYTDRQNILFKLSILSKSINDTLRPIMFSEVKWPHPEKHGDTSLLFFPEVVRPYVKIFHLDWPDHWADANPPMWGKLLSWGPYVPFPLDQLQAGLRDMPNIHTFEIVAPFCPTRKVMTAIMNIPGLRNLRIVDTALDDGINFSIPPHFQLQSFTHVPVLEALRIGEGPHLAKFHDVAYWNRPYRREHGQYPRRGLTRRILTQMHLTTLTYLHVSVTDFKPNILDMDDPFSGTGLDFPNLQTLILTGSFAPPIRQVNLSAFIQRMPKLKDLRLLMAPPHTAPSTAGASQPFGMLSNGEPMNHFDAQVFEKIKSFATSNAVVLTDLIRHYSELERLVVTAIITHPRKPIAPSKEDLEQVLTDLQASGAGSKLKFLRLITEDLLDDKFFQRISAICPSLEFLEVEMCGYRDGDGFEWTEYSDIFSTLSKLKELRIAAPFAGNDDPELDDPEILDLYLRSDRTDFASFLATRLPLLQRVGFEYRKQMGDSHKYEDRWMDFDIIRLVDGSVRLVEAAETWYVFPEVWKYERLFN